MTNRSVALIALAAAIASGPVIAQEPKPKPPAAPAGKPKPPAPPAAKPGTGQKAAAPASAAGLSAAAKARLRTPAKLKDVAPETYKARFETSAGPFVVEVHREWAPRGADRFYNLVKYGFFDGARFFRVVPNFMVQFGLNGDPSIQSAWRAANIPDDPVKQSNKRGYMTFANAGPGTRTTQVFINFKDNAFLDKTAAGGGPFAPFGEVVSGMNAVDKINPQYGEGPDQGRIQMQGDAYLTKAFPKLDYVTKATIEK